MVYNIIEKELGMRVAQAAWYLVDGSDQPVGRLPEFEQLELPMDLLSLVGVGNISNYSYFVGDEQ